MTVGLQTPTLRDCASAFRFASSHAPSAAFSLSLAPVRTRLERGEALVDLPLQRLSEVSLASLWRSYAARQLALPHRHGKLRTTLTQLPERIAWRNTCKGFLQRRRAVRQTRQFVEGDAARELNLRAPAAIRGLALQGLGAPERFGARPRDRRNASATAATTQCVGLTARIVDLPSDRQDCEKCLAGRLQSCRFSSAVPGYAGSPPLALQARRPLSLECARVDVPRLGVVAMRL